jgi:very-short-patch-repair endonuclease
MCEARARVAQVLAFLREFDQIRNKPTRHVRQHLDHLFCRDFPLGAGCRLGVSEFVSDDDGEDQGTPLDAPLLTIDKQHLTAAPAPPAVLDGWLEEAGNDPAVSPQVRSRRSAAGTSSNRTADESFDSDAERVRAFAEWRRRRATWAEAELPRRRVQAFYERLYGIYLQLRRDTEDVELVWATGLLAWRAGQDEILHPLVLSRVDLLFDRDKGRLQVVTTSAVPEVADDILQGLTEQSSREFDDLARAFRASPVAPWDRARVGGFLTQAVNTLSTRGVVVDDIVRPGDDPMIARQDVLLLRKRRVGYARDIERWLEIFKGDVEPPPTVRRIVGVHGDAPDEEAWTSTTGPLLLPLPANPEQEEIARRLARHPGVVVQGPPGTGKSHTIANLVSHLLAHGKTVLITAQTERALRVLRDKVPEAIRNLCVSVIGNDVHAQEELKRSVQAIIEQTGGSRARHERAAAQAEAELRRVQAALGERWEAVSRASRAESAEVTIGGAAWTPTRAGQYLRDHEPTDGWLPDAVSPDGALPLSDGELSELLALVGRISRDDFRAAVEHLPDLAELPATTVFAERAAHGAALRARFAEADCLAHTWDAPRGHATPVLADAIDELRQRFVRALDDLTALRTPWVQTIRTQVLGDPVRRQWWQDVHKSLEARRQAIFEARKLIAHRAISGAAEGAVHQRIAEVEALRAYLADGGSLGLMFTLLRPALKRTRAAWRVDGAEPATVEDVDAILATLETERLRAELVNLVANEIEPLGGPSIRDRQSTAEHAVAPVVESLGRLLHWHEQTWEALRRDLRPIGCELRRRGVTSADIAGVSVVIEEDADEIATVRRVTSVLDGLIIRLGLVAHAEWQADVRERIEEGSIAAHAGALWSVLLDAVRREDPEQWAAAVREVQRLGAIRPDAERLAVLHGALARLAPIWAERLFGASSRPLPSPEAIRAAWLWSQVNCWLDAHLTSPSAEDLRREIDTLRAFESHFIGKLVEHRTWASLQVQDRERQALAGWQQAIARIGKGTGKRVPLLKREAQTLMSEARRAVPVWIMPLSRVIENFTPAGPRFDVVIVDESSQADTFGLLALLRADRAVVVGDDNQISPAAVGQRLATVDQLIAKHLEGIPNNVLYDGQQSLYDLATAAFGGVIRLREHFRCVPEIIGFSNHLSYQGEIQPLRDPTDTPLAPPVVVHRVPGYRAAGSDVNDREADEVAALVAACCGHPLYNECTFGVISLLGEEQARAIFDRVRRLVPPEELDRRGLIAGDAYHFQGDERDVMFLSVVESSGDHRHAVLNKRTDQQRFNVAASRARDQMWIVHSIDAAELNPQDMRARLMTHYSLADQRARTSRDVMEVLRDDRYYFQRMVAQRIIDRGLDVRAEVPVGGFRIDLVVDGDSDSLAVECDGERWHPLDAHKDDVARQIMLERLGWKFLRVRGGQFFRDPERALAPLWRRLDDLGIAPVRPTAAAPQQTSLIDEIRVRATALLRQLQGAPPPVTETAERTPDDACVPAAPMPRDAADVGRAALSGAASTVLDFLARNPGWHGRQDIVTATRVDDEWRPTIDELLERHLVVRRGLKRGTEYRLAEHGSVPVVADASSVAPPPAPPEQAVPPLALTQPPQSRSGSPADGGTEGSDAGPGSVRGAPAGPQEKPTPRHGGILDAFALEIARTSLRCGHPGSGANVTLTRQGPVSKCAGCGLESEVAYTVQVKVLASLDIRCRCGAACVVARGPLGSFVGCSRYPEHRSSRSWTDVRDALGR